MGTPIEFPKSGALAQLTERSRFDADLLMDALGNMPPSLMQSGFRLLNPAEAWHKLTNLLRDAGDTERVRHFVALESWRDDNMAFPGGVYREYIRALYQEDLLCKRTTTIAGTPVDLARLTAPPAQRRGFAITSARQWRRERSCRSSAAMTSSCSSSIPAT